MSTLVVSKVNVDVLNQPRKPGTKENVKEEENEVYKNLRINYKSESFCVSLLES